MADYIQIKNGSTDVYPTIKPSVYRKDITLNPKDAVYDDGYIDISIAGKTPISVGWNANQIDTRMYMLALEGNTLWYGRALAGGLQNNIIHLYVYYI